MKFNFSFVVNSFVDTISDNISFHNFLFNSVSSLTFIASNFEINNFLQSLNQESKLLSLELLVVVQLQLQVISFGIKFFKALYDIFFSDLSSWLVTSNHSKRFIISSLFVKVVSSKYHSNSKIILVFSVSSDHSSLSFWRYFIDFNLSSEGIPEIIFFNFSICCFCCIETFKNFIFDISSFDTSRYSFVISIFFESRTTQSLSFIKTTIFWILFLFNFTFNISWLLAFTFSSSSFHQFKSLSTSAFVSIAYNATS